MSTNSGGMIPPKKAPGIGRVNRTAPKTGSGNDDLDSYAGKNTGGKIGRTNQSVSGKKGNPGPAAKTGPNPLSGNLVAKNTGTKVKNSFPKGKPENRTTW